MEQQNEGLKKELGIFDVAVNVVNISIASGIFILPALIAGIIGGASILAYIICGFMFLLVALSYAEVGSRIAVTGSQYIYIQRAFGTYAGFLANGFLWFGTGVLAAAAIINGIADMLSVTFPVLNIGVYRAIFFFAVFAFFGYINIIGLKQGMIAVKIITLVKILPLILLVVVGIFNIKPINLSWQSFPTFDKLGEASLILFFAFTGGETALNISGEMKNPKRTAPIGLLIGVITIVLFYCLIQIVAQGILGNDILNHKKAPLATVANVLFGSWGFTLLIACAITAMIGSLNSLILVYPRAMFAGAKHEMLPSFIEKVHPQYATPHWAIISYCIISFLMAISGGYKQLLVLATLSMLLLHVGVALAAIKFRLRPSADTQAAFVLRGGLSIPIVALVVLLWFICQSKSNEVIGMLAFTLVLSVLYFIKRGRFKF